jgi:hypothetical protein
MRSLRKSGSGSTWFGVCYAILHNTTFLEVSGWLLKAKGNS